ncbi:flagellin [Aureimonas populi]|uniref:Flagellin n=1 Tax=Aureimonas populi TaxID=1701758 RepID=A0ABW5CJP6_9HYPH|nr:flagellin [Aureimonas populi]
MTSINTNIAAQTALRTLQSTNADLDATQGRISTGLKIAEAKDNAAYWSISTTLKSDNKALSTVKDALGLGAATVDTAYQGLNETLSVLDEIKSKLTAATQENVDKDAVQAEIAELQKQLKAIATSATFSGENWLSVNSSAEGYTSDKSVVSAFNRNNGVVSLDTINVAISSFVLIDANEEVTGVLETGTLSDEVDALATAITGITAVDGADETAADAGDAEGGSATMAFAGPLVFGKDDQLTLNVGVNGGTAVELVIDQALVNSALAGVTDGTIADEDAMKTVIEKALENAGVTNVTVTTGTDEVILTGAPVDGATGGTIAVAAEASAKAGVLELDITGLDRAGIEALISKVSQAADSVTAGAANLGAVASRIELQQTFVSNLMDTIDRGVSGLVDADMNEESTRLQALQVKQQLGVQALSIANQSAQNVLRLFQ